MGTTPIVRLQPPALPPTFVSRPRVDRRLDDALDVPLTAVVADGGFGKTVALAAWADANRACWLTLTRGERAVTSLSSGLLDAMRPQVPELDASALALADHLVGPGGDEAERAETYAVRLVDALTGRSDRPLVVVLDGLEELGEDSSGGYLLEAMVRTAPPQLHLVVASRTRLPFGIDRLRGRGQVVEIGPDTLRLDLAEVTALLTGVLGEPAADIANEVLRVTDGWAAAVRLTAEALRDVPADRRAGAVGRLRGSGSRLLSFLAGDVLATLPASARTLLRAVAPLPDFDQTLCDELGVGDAAPAIDALLRRGLVRRRGDADVFHASELMRACVGQVDPLSDDERAATCRAGARWLLDHGEGEAALELLCRTRDEEALAATLDEAGQDLLAQGRVSLLVEAGAMVPPALRTPEVETALGHAHMVTGDWEGSLECMRRATAGSSVLPVMVAWRMGIILHLRGDIDGALATYARAEPTSHDADQDVSLLESMRASALWLKGDLDSCRKAADTAMDLARSSQEPNALSAAHTVLAMLAAADGDRRANDAHDRLALEYSEQSDNVLQIIRIRSNRGSHLVETGEYQLAIEELDVAIDLAELTGFATFLAMARSNRGQALAALGRLEEARAEYTAAATIFDRLGSGLVVYPLLGLGDLHRVRGEVAPAHATYERVISLAESMGDVQALVPAQAGLARVLAGRDPERARELAAEARATKGLDALAGVLGAGWVALHAGDTERAAALGAEADELAHGRRDPASRAEALELRALSTSDPRRCRAVLAEALEQWEHLGAEVARLRVGLVLALLDDDDAAAADLRGQLRIRGVSGAVGDIADSLGALATGVVPALPAPPEERSRSRVTIEALGAFRVYAGGNEVPVSAWQSRKARDLLKLLVVRRGRPVPREAVIDHLWPGKSLQDVGGALSAALSVARTVLDPHRALPSDHYLVGTPESIRLDLDHVDLDVDEFLRRAHTVDPGADIGDEPVVEVEELARLEALCDGDLLEDDPYEDWVTATREECRAAHLAVLRRLVVLTQALGRVDEAVGFGLRLLALDPYDEEAHLALVAILAETRRHGEAHRHYRTYTARMRELQIEPAPFPG